MKIAFDMDAVVRNRYSGFYTYGMGLLNGLLELENGPGIVLFAGPGASGSIPESLRNHPGVTVRESGLKIRRLEDWWRWSRWPRLQRFTGDFDVYHCVHHLVPPAGKAKRVMTVHDLRRYRLPELYAKSRLGRFERALQQADHILAISNSTRDDLQEFFGIENDRITVVPLAVETPGAVPSVNKKEQAREAIGKRLNRKIDKMILAFSSPDRRKNITRIIESFAKAKEQLGQGCVLAVIGSPPKNEDLQALTKKCGADVLLLGTVESVREYLVAADVLVFTSLYEGFGLPILEAFSASTAVITSNVSSMPEVAGEAGLCVDPYDTNAAAEAMVKVISDDAYRESLAQKGKLRLQQFSWEKTARQTLDVYKKLAGA